MITCDDVSKIVNLHTIAQGTESFSDAVSDVVFESRNACQCGDLLQVGLYVHDLITLTFVLYYTSNDNKSQSKKPVMPKKFFQ